MEDKSMSAPYTEGDLAADPDSNLAHMEILSADRLRMGMSSSTIRGLVSKKKKRYVGMGFDLDLAYITPTVIAMGFPSSGFESLYRNPMQQVVSFLDSRHGSACRVYNLCSEPFREYEGWHFGGRVETFPFDDHNAPPFEMIRPFCLSAERWMEKHPDNVIAVHCKAGKGRTGVMICCLLLHAGAFTDAEQCMSYYGAARTLDGKGVTIPSQRRYIHYYANLLKNGPRGCPQVRLTGMLIDGIPRGGLKALVHIKNGNSVFTEMSMFKARARDVRCEVPFSTAVVCGDVKISVFDASGFGSPKLRFAFWLHTGFLEGGQLVLRKNELDKAIKDKNNKRFAPDMRVVIKYELVSESSPFQHAPESGIQALSQEKPTSGLLEKSAAAASSSQPKPVELDKPELMRAVFDYSSGEQGHLNISTGQLLYVLRKDPSGWWLASANGQVGWIPQKYAMRVGGRSANSAVSIV